MRSRKSYTVLIGFFAVVLACTLLWNIRIQSVDSVVHAWSNSAATEEIKQNIFPKDKVVDVRITIDEDDFQNMLDNASAEEMKTASVEYNGIKLDNIGIRTKGNLSLRSVVSSDSDRYSFKLSFDEYISGQTLSGISKINLNNNYSDATSMREFLTYELAESMGLPTPEYSYVNVYVNGELWGFYLAIEQIGDAYLERHFDNSYGALYKAEFGGGGGGGGFGDRGAGGAGGVSSSGGGDLLWQDDNIESYSSLVQKSKSSNDDILVDMLDELNNGTDYEKVLDVEGALKYIGLNAVTVNMDSYLGSNQQNYYLYEDDGVFSVLPWDYNMSFGGMGSGSSQVMIDEPTQGALADRPLIAKLLGVAEYKEKYHEMIQSMINGYLSDEVFEARVNEIKEMISPYVKKDPRPFYTYDQYESAIPQLVTFTSSRVANVSGQLDGSIAASGDGSGSGSGMGGGGMGGFGGGQMRQGDRTQLGGQRPTGEQVPSGMQTPSDNKTSSDGNAASKIPSGEKASSDGQATNGARSGEEMSSRAQDAAIRTVTLDAHMQSDVMLTDFSPTDGKSVAEAEQGQSSQTQQNEQGAQVPNGQGAQAPNAQGGQMPNDQGAQAPNAQGGQMPDDQGAQAPNGQGGQMQNGPGGEFGGGDRGFGGGQGGPGGMGGMGAMGGQAGIQPQGSNEGVITTAVALAVLGLAGLFVTLYKRKRL
ncbi:CotH kinase family protein [Cohnella sp. WQ 127256]|uniref:CotH kinase family protein n=1 Tax=Cohnella sp. WQ 127256 TaxID=2938790 RepID=UPI0021182F44|nr:CotH kinase family protein [Cohnella sp. WQ 127256]